jgi:hypothetical protein
VSTAPASGPLGVLLVHGIGEQKVGDTLLGFTEPLHAFCEEWVAGASEEGADAYAKVTDTRLRRLTGDDDAPSHTRLRIGLRRPGSEDAGNDGRMEWLIAESHWAERFPVPTFRQIFAWLFSVVAPVIVRHVDFRLLLPTTVKNVDRIGRLIAAQETTSEAGPVREASVARWAVKGYNVLRGLALAVLARVQNVVSVTLAAVMLVFLAALLPLAVVPRTRRAVVRVQSKLANSLGDSYVLLRSPLRGDAMVAQVERDIEWLESQGRTRIAIIAHSQGAEVARRVLCRRRGGPASVDLFVTFGAGIEKLDAVRQLAERPFVTWSHFFLRAVGAAAFVAIPFLMGSPVLLVIAVLLAALAPEGAKRIRERLVKPLTDSKLGGRALEARGTHWLDLFASSDPVSEGHLDLDGHHSRSVRVTNYRSTLRDHTSYWQNVEEFTSRIAFALAALSGWPRFDALRSGDRRRARRAIAERQRRTKWLLLGRWSAGLTGLLLVALARNPLTMPDSVARSADRVPWVSDEFARSLERQLEEPTVRSWLGVALAVLLLAAFHWMVTVRVWNLWDRAAAQALVSRQPASKVPQILTYVVIAFPPVAAAVVLVVVAGATADLPQLALGVLALFALAVVAAEVVRRRWAEPVPVEIEQRFGEAATDSPTIAMPRPVGPRLDSDRAAPVVAHGCLWVSSGVGRAVVRIPLADGPEKTIPVGGNTLAMAADDAGVWVTTDEAEIVHVPADGSCPTRPPIRLSAPCPALAVSNGHVWAIDGETGRVLGFTKEGEEAGRSARLGTPTALAVGHDRIWVADKAVRGVLCLDPADPAATGKKIEIGLTPAAMECTPNGLWMWFRPGLVGQLPPGDQPHRLGSVLRALTSSPRRRGDEWVVPANGTTWVLRGRDGRWLRVAEDKLSLAPTDVCLPAPVTGVTHHAGRIYVTTR